MNLKDRRPILLSLVGLRPPADSKIVTNFMHAMIHELFLARGLDKETIIMRHRVS